MNKIFIGALLLIITFFTSCDLEELPENVNINDPQSLTEIDELLNNAYNNLGWPLGGNAQLFSEINGDNINGLAGINSDETEIYNRSTSFFNNTIRDNMYRGFYRIILDANVVLNFLQPEYLQSIGEDSSSSRVAEMRGEALFLRGYMHFEISRFMSHSPGFTSDNSHLGVPYRKDYSNALGELRGSVAENYTDIISDLKEAESLLEAVNSKNQYFANKSVAQSVLAKVFFQGGFGPDLETGKTNYQSAYEYANLALQNTTATFDTNLYQGTNDFRFAGTLDASNNTTNTENPNTETIFGIISESTVNSKGDGFRRYRSDFTIGNVTTRLMQEVFNSIPSTDKRRSLIDVIDGEYFLNKFNRSIFHVPLIHYSEILLIRAESAAESGNISQAEMDLNQILTRAGLSNISGISTEQLIDLTRNQRRIELLGEGNRVNDLKRIGIKETSLTIRNAPWNCNGILFQFPATEVFTGFIQNPTGGCN